MLPCIECRKQSVIVHRRIKIKCRKSTAKKTKEEVSCHLDDMQTALASNFFCRLAQWHDAVIRKVPLGIAQWSGLAI